MHSESDHRIPSDDDLSAVLKGLRPAKSEMDTATLFYRAGWAASQSEKSRNAASPLPMLAAALIAALVTVPAAYFAGQSSVNRPGIASDRHPRPIENWTRPTLDRERSGNAEQTPGDSSLVDSPAPESNVNKLAVAATPPIDDTRPGWLNWGFEKMWVALVASSTATERRADFEVGDQSVAAFHFLVSTDPMDGENWPAFPERLSVGPHTPARPTGSDPGLSRRSTIAVGDARQMIVTMEAVR